MPKIACLFAACLLPCTAQWLTFKTPGIPRSANGKPNLTAAAPRVGDKPDLSGLWNMGVNLGYAANLTSDLGNGDIQPWAADLSRRRLAEFGKDDPETVGCRAGGPRHITRPGIVRVIQSPTVIAILFEDLSFRQIFLDGRTLEKDPNPTWMGYSVGRWEGDTLVVETNGFNDRTWLDFAGHPHTEALRMTERIRRTDFGHLDIQVTLTDPGAYNKPWTVVSTATFAADTEMIETVCSENEQDRSHLVGRTEAERQVKVAPEVLAKYAGTYVVQSSTVLDDRAPQTVFTVTADGGDLYIDMAGKGRVLMTPLSQTSFSPRLLGTFDFVSDASGKVTHMMVYSAEEALRAVKR